MLLDIIIVVLTDGRCTYDFFFNENCPWFIITIRNVNMLQLKRSLTKHLVWRCVWFSTDGGAGMSSGMAFDDVAVDDE